jgi:glycosyltransferase involved in cell wall biosynthesis
MAGRMVQSVVDVLEAKGLRKGAEDADLGIRERAARTADADEHDAGGGVAHRPWSSSSPQAEMAPDLQTCSQRLHPAHMAVWTTGASFFAPNATDRGFFRGEADRLLCRRGLLRKESELQVPVIFFVGRLVEKMKRVSTLIKAVAQLERNEKKVSFFDFMGSDPNDLSLLRFKEKWGSQSRDIYTYVKDYHPFRSKIWGLGKGVMNSRLGSWFLRRIR